jgi:hypothetical protein
MHKLKNEKSTNIHVGTNTQLFSTDPTILCGTASNTIIASIKTTSIISTPPILCPFQSTNTTNYVQAPLIYYHVAATPFTLPSGTQGSANESHQHQSVRGSVTRMGMMLSQSFHNTLMITPRGSPKTPVTIGRTAHEITPSTTQSPV